MAALAVVGKKLFVPAKNSGSLKERAEEELAAFKEQ